MKLIQENKKAYHDYNILDKFEAGIVLKGAEVKAIRNKSVNLKGSYCALKDNTITAINIHISKLITNNSWSDYNETRDRNLLLNKKEIKKIRKAVVEDGYTIIPLKIYFSDNNKCKLEIGIAKGKNNYDKRNDLKEKDIKRDNDRIMKEF